MANLDKELAGGVKEMGQAVDAATEFGDQVFERLTHGRPRSKVGRLIDGLMQGVGLGRGHKIRRGVDRTTKNVLEALRKTIGE